MRSLTRRRWQWLVGYMKPHGAAFSLFVVLSVIEIVIGLVVPWPMKILVDSVLGRQPLSPLLARIAHALSIDSRLAMLAAVCAAGLLLGLLSEVISLAHTQLQVSIGSRMVLALQRDLFAHLEKLSLRYHQTAGTGDAMYRLGSDAYCVDNIIMSGGFPLVSATLTLVLMFTVLFRLDPVLALLALVVVPFLFLLIHRYSPRLTEVAEHVKELESHIYTVIHEVFSSIKLVKAFSRERDEHRRFADQGLVTYRERMRLTFHESLFAALISAITYSGTALVLGVGGWHVLQGKLSVGELLVAIAYLGSVYGPLSTVSHTVGNLQGALASARRVDDTLRLEPEVDDAPDAVDVPRLRGQIRFENVSFWYDESRPVLSDIGFEAQPGETVALVGLTGAGKTTLVSLIPRFYDAPAGRVTIDDIDVRKMTLRSLHESISIVLQDPILFSSTIEENIKYGRLDATHDEVVAVARAAQAHDFITQLPQGYDTRLGEAGSQLSGGERQRLSIARALLKNAPILILDEPTSSLDARVEWRLFHALETLTAGRTTIVIAHRLSTIRNADKIIVLEGGRIAGTGKHDELLSTNALYRELCERLSLTTPAVPLEIAQ